MTTSGQPRRIAGRAQAAALGAALAFVAQAGVTLAAAAAPPAPKPADFTLRLPLTLEAVGGLHQLTFDATVLSASRWHDLRDIRVFNAKGEALPFGRLPAAAPGEAGRAADPQRARITMMRPDRAAGVAPSAASPAILPAMPPAVPTSAQTAEQGTVPPADAPAVPMVALPAAVPARDRVLADVAVRVQRADGNIVVSIGGAGPLADAATRATVADPGGYLFDLRSVKGRDGDLVLRFADDAPDTAAPVQLLGSDDLVDWRVVARGPLVRNARFVPPVEQARFTLHATPAFLRLDVPARSASAAARLAAAHFVPPPALPPPALARLKLATTPVADLPGAVQVGIPPGLPVQTLEVRLAQTDTVARLRVLAYQPAVPQRHRLRLGHLPRPGEPGWRTLREFDAFRVQRDGAEIESPPVPLDASSDTLRIVALDGVDAFGGVPDVFVQWTPVRVAFAARGPGPYTLAVGLDDPDLPPPTGLAAGLGLALAPLLPPDDPAGARLPRALLPVAGVVPTAPAGVEPPTTTAALAAADPGPTDARLALWAVLALAVAGVAAMAFGVVRQLRAPAAGDQSTPGTG